MLTKINEVNGHDEFDFYDKFDFNILLLDIADTFKSDMEEEELEKELETLIYLIGCFPSKENEITKVFQDSMSQNNTELMWKLWKEEGDRIRRNKQWGL